MLSAVEGLKVVTPAFNDFVQPLAIVTLVVLSSMQWRGTAKVSALFGPITALWFLIIGTAGIQLSRTRSFCCFRNCYDCPGRHGNRCDRHCQPTNQVYAPILNAA